MAANIINGYFVFFLQENHDFSTTLREVDLVITSDSKCSRTYDIFGGITDSMICAGNSHWGRITCSVIGP